MLQVVKSLPKIDLHLHLDGSVKPKTVLELATEQGVALPKSDLSSLKPYLQIEDDCPDLKSYLSKFDLVSQVLHTEKALERVAFELVEQAHSQNCKYIEVRFGPQLHRQKGLSLEVVIGSVIKGLNKGEQTFGVRAKAIACCLRHHSVEVNMEVIEAASSFLNSGLVGVDLAGDEASYPAYLFRSVFKIADKKGLPITIHAGEAAGANNIKDAIHKLGASRIGHGVRLKEDMSLFNEVYSRGIPLEMCPISNIQTKASDSWKEYPIREYFDQGLLVTVNTDNLTVSKTTLTKEYMILAKHFEFTTSELAQLVMNGIEASFLEVSDKKELKNICLQEYKQLEGKISEVI